jgi:hypothetical protein
MRIKSNPVRPTEQAYALLLTLVFMAISLMLLASVGTWATSESTLTARNNAYNSAVGAAEAATEVVIAQTSRDFLHQALSANTSTYASVLPGNYVPDGWPADYQCSDGLGNKNQTDIRCKGWQQWTNLDSEFVGLYVMITTYEITSNARRLTGSYPVAAGVRQSIQFTSVPIFQYAIFYTLDLEINPGPPMIVTGKTHGNADVYLAPQDTLEFVDSVSVVGNIYFNRSTNDATGGSKTAPIFDSTYGQSSSMTLPVGTDNNPSNIVQILDPPPFGEDPSSALGRERFYNKSDLIIITTNNLVTVQFNDYEDGSKFTVIPTNSPSGSGNSGYSFVKTNALFYDPREGKQVMGTDIDIAALTNWLAGSGFSLNLLAQAKMGHSINSIYVDDQRPALGKLPAVRVINGQYLPSSGMTIATPDPLYIKGNFNAPDLTVGSTNTSMTAPASLVSDSITILSPQWDDSWNSSTPLSARGATDATVNAAFLSGIVQSVTVDDQAHYSGGVENFPRFLEDWSKSTLTYNGSMVVMFSSRYATNFWIAPGTYYNPPTRKWAFDQNFLSVNKLPPATPQVRKLQRGNWSVVAVSDN